ncbi:MAG: hypothetical protein VB948_12720 [Pseudomonadales bacterium]
MKESRGHSPNPAQPAEAFFRGVDDACHICAVADVGGNERASSASGFDLRDGLRDFGR